MNSHYELLVINANRHGGFQKPAWRIKIALRPGSRSQKLRLPKLTLVPRSPRETDIDVEKCGK